MLSEEEELDIAALAAVGGANGAATGMTVAEPPPLGTNAEVGTGPTIVEVAGAGANVARDDDDDAPQDDDAGEVVGDAPPFAATAAAASGTTAAQTEVEAEEADAAEADALVCVRFALAGHAAALPAVGADGAALRTAAAGLLASVEATLDARRPRR